MTTDLKAKFDELAAQWKRETSHISNTTKMSMNLNYQKIIGMGPAVVPLLLEELRRKPNHWFWALHVITGENPVPEESEGVVKEMAEAWIAWDEKQVEVDVTTELTGDHPFVQWWITYSCDGDLRSAIAAWNAALDLVHESWCDGEQVPDIIERLTCRSPT